MKSFPEGFAGLTWLRIWVFVFGFAWSLATAPLSAADKQIFTRAAGTYCLDLDCNNLVVARGITPGENQYEAACALAWSQVDVFPGDAYYGATPDGCYYQHVDPPSGPLLWGFLSTIEIFDPKNNGDIPCCVGNPVNPGVGNKFQIEVDYTDSAPSPLRFERTYNYDTVVQGNRIGTNWRSLFDRSLKVWLTNGQIDPTVPAVAYRHDGKILYFSYANGQFTPTADIADRLTAIVNANNQITGFRYVAARGDEIEVYDTAGRMTSLATRAGVTLSFTYSGSSHRLLNVQDPFGRGLVFTYNSAGRVATMTDPAGQLFTYGYDGSGRLTSVTYPGIGQRLYHYNEPAYTGGADLPNALTGITDENNVRYATFSYAPTGQSIATEHAGGAEQYTLVYSGNDTQVTDAAGATRTQSYQTIHGVAQLASVSQPAASGQGTATSTISYDANGNVASRTDFNGNRTDYAYDTARNLQTARTEGLTASGATTPHTRTISTEWDANFRLPAQIAEPLRITTNIYDADGTQCGARGALCSRTIQPTSDASGVLAFSATPSGTPRTWTYTYNANGSVLTVNGPRTDVADVAMYTYYANDASCPTANGGHATGCRGRVQTIENALSQITTVSAYNGHGQPLSIVDLNGLITTITYDARQRLKTRTVGSEVTSYDYDGVGQLTKVTLPDGSFLSYSYDGAHRLTGMQDNLGNSIAYTLDAMGNRTLEEVRDPANQLAQTRSRVYNSLSRLFQELGAQGQTTEYAYDNQGNVISVKDPLNRITTNQYDALNRLKQVTSPAPISAVTQYAYNGLDALTQVTDPRSLVTGYAVDGLGNLNVQASPDTGTTTNTYDAAGNLLTQTDAKTQTTTYAYDALNRVTLITFHDGSKQAYAYDQGANGIGRLSSITETDPANQITSQIAYAYDQHGRVTSETRTVAGVQYVLAYRYDSSGRLDQLTYPSGRTVDYAFDALGRVSGVTTTKTGEQPQAVVSNVAYHPFGGVKSYTLGNGQVYARGIDLDGRIASYTLGSQSFAIGYDAASRISFISDIGNPPNTNTYGYDDLDRLTSAVLPATPYAYDYDAVGNRTSRTAGSSTDNYAYSATSNRIASITPASGPVRNFIFDANGSTTADGLNTYTYDVRGRMVQAVSTLGTTSYQVNALGQRIRKTNSLGDMVFHYDTRGRLIAETDPGGGMKRELIYLGDIPVGVVQ